MVSSELDNVDKGILYLLQENARTNTTTDIGEKVGVSSSTVSNRIKKLEDQGIVTGYHPTVDYEETGMDHHLLIIGTVPFEEREAVADEIMDVSGVVCLRELLLDTANLTIELVGRAQEDMEQAIAELNSIGVDIERMAMLNRERTQPYNHFGKQYVNEEDTG